jgi:hypothetical protein
MLDYASLLTACTEYHLHVELCCNNVNNVCAKQKTESSNRILVKITLGLKKIYTVVFMISKTSMYNLTIHFKSLL